MKLHHAPRNLDDELEGEDSEEEIVEDSEPFSRGVRSTSLCCQRLRKGDRFGPEPLGCRTRRPLSICLRFSFLQAAKTKGGLIEYRGLSGWNKIMVYLYTKRYVGLQTTFRILGRQFHHAYL